MTAPEANPGWLEAPEPLRGADGEGWTRYSIVHRLPETGGRVLAENNFPTQIAAAIQSLINEIPHALIQVFEDPTAPDINTWQRYLEPMLTSNWLEAPWFFLETYFYRRIIALTGYFRDGSEPWRDPFHFQKTASLEAWVESLSASQASDSLADALLGALWGNQADLSLWPQIGSASERQAPRPAKERLLADDRGEVERYLTERASQLKRIDIILDNAGQELLLDLLLASRLMSRFNGAAFHFHLKAHPTFVSDATKNDFLRTLDRLKTADSEAARQLAGQIFEALDLGVVSLHSHFYWTSPLAGWDMPRDLMKELASSDLLVFKGDANYRRLLGDRHWPLTTSLPQVLGYLPTPVLLLRTLKSEIAIGLDQARIERAGQVDDEWMINGNWGLIQFCQPDD